LAFVALLALPTSLAGGVMALLLGGGEIALGSLFGFLAVLAIAARTTILLFTHFQQLEQAGETRGPELVLRGARERLVPILMSSLTTAVFLLPVVVGGTRAGFEVVQPLAVVILGGLVTSTLLSLFVLPTLYLRLAPKTVPAAVSTQALRQPGTELAQS
jgi:Cu/Ag efflux pump CusA